MKLKTVHVKNFKCVKDSTEFGVDERVTALVGKNEAGKTALVQAMYKLNPVVEEDGDFKRLEYPRMRLEDYDENIRSNSPEALVTTWILDGEDKMALEAVIGPAAKDFQIVRCKKSYDNIVRFDFDLDEQAVAIHLVEEAKLLEDERSAVGGAKDVRDLASLLAGVDDPSQRQKVLAENVGKRFAGGTAAQAVAGVLLSRLPHMVYFSQYMRMPGQVALSELKREIAQKQVTPGSRIFLAFLALINKQPDELEKIGQFESLQADLEGASNRLTREIFKYWTQNRHLRVQFRFEQGLPDDPAPFNAGYVLRTRIENSRHGVTTSFDERSAGFVWFFSFLVWFSQVRKNYGDKLILLLDEPGLSLHAKAQHDLLRYIEERLAPSYQVVYTTHSPFLIDPANLLRARTVEDIYLQANPSEPFSDEEDLGTKVGGDVLSTDRDTVFPLQAALGYDITQTLFIGEHSLLVEGPSEVLYLPWFRRALASRGRATLDPRWTIVPCGGIKKVAAFLSLFAGNRMHIAVLTDIAQGDKKTVRDLRESKLLRDGHVLTADMYTGMSDADIEDLVGQPAYLDLVNKCYNLPANLQIKPLAQGDPGSDGRVVKRVEEYFRTLPSEIEEFNHYYPAEYLTKSGIDLALDGIDEALDRFEKLFADLNALL